MTQNEIILAHLNEYDGITNAEARSFYGIMRLGSRINELRNAGHNIVSIWEHSLNRYDKMVYYVRYRLQRSAE